MGDRRLSESMQRGARVAWTVAVAALLIAGPAQAHVVYGTATFFQLVQEADLVLHARVTDAHGTWPPHDPASRRSVVSVAVLETLKGPPQVGSITFVPQGHGVATYADGDDVVVFLQRIARSRELAGTAVAEHVGWISRQESVDRLVLGAGGDAFLAALRAYAAVDAQATAEARLTALRRVTVKLLTSREPRLAVSAVRDLALAADAPLVTVADVPVLTPMLDDDRIVIGVRIGLLAELERRRLVQAPQHWARLIDGTSGRERLSVIRASAAHPSAAVTASLLRVLDGSDSEAAAAAAVSLGTPSNESAVQPLAAALARGEPALRQAAIRGLGRIQTPSARRSLELAAAFHLDPATRRRAKAETVLLIRHASVAPGGYEAAAPVSETNH